jgi:hypothetical protein
MTDAVTVALIVAVPPTLLGIAQLISSMKNGSKIEGVHLSINSRMDELVRAAKAQGRQDERDSQAEC